LREFLQPVRIKFLPGRNVEYDIKDDACCEEYTGKGLGRFMMETMLETAKKIGLEQLELEVVAGNDRAMHLYKAMGFEIYGTFPDNMKYPDGTYADCYWMMRKL